PRVTSARLLIDAHERDRVYLEIKALPHVAGATLRSAAFEIFNETSAQMQMMTRAILVAFAGIVAVGVVYNGARVVLAERSRELASLRVLGFTRAEISTILLGELLIQLLLAGPLGAWLGWLLAYGAIAGIDTELYRFPLVILPRTYAFAIGSVWVAGIVAALVVRQKLDHLDLVEVLKTRECTMRVFKWILGIALLLALVAAFVVASLPKPPVVEVTTIQQGFLAATVDGDGRTRVKDRHTITAPLYGNLARIELEAGDPVRIGR